MPRGFSKSRIFTHGGLTWDLLRNPDEQAIIVNAISDKAQEFYSIVTANYCKNELIRALFPEYVPGKKGKSTDKEFVLPNRGRNYAAPSLTYYGLTGAAEGGHFTLIQPDDLVGLDSVDQGYQSNAQMGTAKKWFNTNMEALRLTLASREIGAATRYALDDCYEPVYKSCKTLTGWKKGDIKQVEGGEWDIYYRLVEEDGVYLRPDVMDEPRLTAMIKADPVAAMLNYYNSPSKTGLAEFAEVDVGDAQLFMDEDGEYLLRRGADNFSDKKEATDVMLRDCEVVMTTDLAATDEKDAKARTCRSSIAAWAMDGDGFYYRFWSRVGFFDIYQSVGYLFEGYGQFKRYVQNVLVEKNGFQRIMKDVLKHEQEIRGEYLPIRMVLAQGDKKARIRAALTPKLMREKIWVVRGAGKEFREELKMFPMSDTRVDVLDESEKALTYLERPLNVVEKLRREEAEVSRAYASMLLPATGY
ncbi:MAG: hypothetical protein HC888_12730 [Candidatus Competibacteraceae bacterium]|nr:hypothetical protein [Candidatus Competibacteraceae bacterium]